MSLSYINSPKYHKRLLLSLVLFCSAEKFSLSNVKRHSLILVADLIHPLSSDSSVFFSSGKSKLFDFRNATYVPVSVSPL